MVWWVPSWCVLLLLLQHRQQQPCTPTHRVGVQLNNSSPLGLRILQNLFVREVITDGAAFGIVHSGDQIVGPSFKAVVAKLKTKSDAPIKLELIRPGSCVLPEIEQQVLSQVIPRLNAAANQTVPKCIVAYGVGKTGLMNQHMAHLAAIEFALQSGCMLKLAHSASRESFNVQFGKAKFNLVSFEKL